ncbi:MAG: DUF4276 family protein [Betaproteobacteria bacterium]|jgi:hypothetical protein
MSLRVQIYAEGPAEDRGQTPLFGTMPGEPLAVDSLGPAHHLVGRMIEKERKIPRAAISFLAPARIEAKKVQGSDLHVTKHMRQLLQAAMLHEAHLAIVLVDADGDSQRRRLLTDGTQDLSVPRVIAVAVQEFEAWLLADQRALVDGLQVTETPPAPESWPPGEAKQLLRRWLDDCAPTPSQVEVAEHVPTRRIAIASALDLDLLARQRSFQQFQVDLRAALHGQP